MKVKVTSPSFSKNNILVNKLMKHFSNVEINATGKRFTKKELIDFLKDADAAIIGLEKIDKEVIDNTNLRAIAKYGVGIDNIDIDYLKKKNIKFCFKKGVNKIYVAEFTLGLIISVMRNIVIGSYNLKIGKFIKNGGYSIFNKNLGIIGVGNIGKALISLIKPFNMDIYVNDIIEQKEYYEQNNLKEVSKEYIFRNCDIITIHTPLTHLTVNLINKKTLNLLRNEAVLINTARGKIINFKELKEVLQKKDIIVATDVFDPEPPEDKELLKLDNFIPTPHIAGNSKESVLAMGNAAISSLLECLNE